MTHIYSIVIQLIFELFYSRFQFLNLLLPALPTIIFIQYLVDVKILPKFTSDYSRGLIQL